MSRRYIIPRWRARSTMRVRSLTLGAWALIGDGLGVRLFRWT